MKLDLTDNEAQVLLNLINVAVQAKGLEAAESALHFAKKIQDAKQATPEKAKRQPK